ncbi:MAG: phospholipid carrier-dependent glycosyltransferase [Proteobacteria bacterium]|nr:phospholipid carrier-dependent glycosyltransferase [Pseudomonadota bacterium]
MKKTIFILIALFGLMYILPLGLRPLVDPDETRYAEIPREMMASNDWVVPRLAGVLYFEKPVMGYWANALSMKVFGQNNFAVRFPLAMAAGLSACLVFFLGRRFSGDPRLAFPSALIFMTFLEVFGVGVFNTLDSLLAFFLTACLSMFFLAWDSRDSRKHYYFFLFLSGIFCGLACHTKGFLAFVVPISVIVPFVIWEKEWKRMFTIPWIPISVALLVMLPWGIMIHLRENDFWNYFFWNEHIRRFLADNAQHKEPFYYFFGVLILGMFPWTILIPAGISGFRIKGFNTSFRRFTACWFVFPFLFFSASSGKLATYILPCFPPLALMLTWGLFDYFKRDKRPLFDCALVALLLFPVCGITGVLLLQHGFSPDMDELFSDNRKVILFVMAMSAFAFFLLGALRQGDIHKKIALFALSPVLFYTFAHVLTPDQAVLRNSPVPFILENKDKIPADALIVSPSTPIKSVCWALKRNDIFLLDDGGELRYGFSQTDQRDRQLSFDAFNAMVTENKNKRNVVLILDERRYKRWQDQLPQPDFLIKSGEDGYIFAIFK